MPAKRRHPPRPNTLVELDFEGGRRRAPTTAERKRANAAFDLWRKAMKWLARLRKVEGTWLGPTDDINALIVAVARGAPRPVVERLERQRADLARASAVAGFAVALNGVRDHAGAGMEAGQIGQAFDALPKDFRELVAVRLWECESDEIGERQSALHAARRAQWEARAREAMIRAYSAESIQTDRRKGHNRKTDGQIAAAVGAVAWATKRSTPTIWRAWSEAKAHVHAWTDLSPDGYMSELWEMVQHSD